MYPLYPPIKPYNCFHLPVGDQHALYVEESGNINGIPVLFIHGGPGAGSSDNDRRFFDPEKYRIVLYDQRGAGRSTPHAALNHNTSQHLVADIERIREHLSIERWVLFGCSWGSTLSLLYAQEHVERVMGMVLRGIFLCRQKDLDWFYQYGANQIFPDYWQQLIEPLPLGKRDNIIAAYYELLTGDNELAKMNAAKHWALWEGQCATLRQSHSVIDTFSNIHLALSLARIETHYFINKAFITENQILDNMRKLAEIPATIIHGRYDVICALDNAIALQQRWPGAGLHIIREAGHASRDPGILDALVKATDDMAKELLSGD